MTVRIPLCAISPRKAKALRENQPLISDTCVTLSILFVHPDFYTPQRKIKGQTYQILKLYP